MEFRVLGPLEVWQADGPVPVGGPKQRRVLAALVLGRGGVVSIEQLIDAVWDTDPPASARRQVQNAVSALRQTPIGAVLAAQGLGYMLQVPATQIDAGRFEQYLANADAARTAGDLTEAAQALRSGLALWRGPALAGVGGRVAGAAAAHLEQRRLSAFTAWAEVTLDLDRPAEVVDELVAVEDRYPLSEPLAVLLMLALYRCGRAAESLTYYHRVRQRLADELGIDPGPQLRALYERVLTNDPTLDHQPPTAAGRGPDSARTPPADVPSAPPTGPTPAQLPGDTFGFAGRDAELIHLDALVAEPSQRPTTIVISGSAGVGKTSLAVHWARHAARRFPDGQLFVDLRGFDPTRPPMSSDQTIATLLDALVAGSERVPSSLEAKSGLLRSLLAGRRMLIVLDDARDADQVRPLLPGSASCLVLVTSRHRLGGLSVSDGAHPVILEPLSTQDARQLLVARLGARRVAAEQAATDDLIALCARLPLALAIVAARAAANPAFPLGVLVAELRNDEHRLDALADGDAATDVRVAFAMSYRSLSDPAARLFRLLGHHPGPHITTLAAASLVGVPRVLPLLGELERANLVIQPIPGRYVLHDLLRAFAAELVRDVDSDAERRAATARILDHYLHVAYGADLSLYPHRFRFPLPPPGPDVAVPAIADHDRAMAWFMAEEATLMAIVDHAFQQGFDTHAWKLASTLGTYLDRRGLWSHRALTSAKGLEAARRHGDLVGQAHATLDLASACIWLGRYDEAHAFYDQSQHLFHEIGDWVGEAHSHLNRAMLHEQQDDHRAALQHAQQALDLFEATGHRSGQAKALNSLGWYQAAVGYHAPALASCQRALSLLREHGDRYNEAATWDSLGYIHHQLANHADAISCYQRSVDLWRELGDRHTEASVLDRLGDAHLDAGNPAQARAAWLSALRIHEKVTRLDAPAIRQKVSQLA